MSGAASALAGVFIGIAGTLTLAHGLTEEVENTSWI
jgi:hypothetical protein